MFQRFADAVIGRRSSIVVALLAFVVSGMLLGTAGSESSTVDSAIDRLPVGMDSTEVVKLQQSLPATESTTALIVYANTDGSSFSPEQINELTALGGQFLALGDSTVPMPPLIPSDNLQVAITSVELADGEDYVATSAAVDEMRELAKSAPAGVDVYVSGPAGLQADIANVFKGANITLLIVTASVVAGLLLITYRSPLLWLVPLTVVGIADRVAVTAALKASEVTGIPMDESVTGILSVLVFGAGTDYALLLIARYRDELRVEPDRFTAMRTALTRSFDPIGASATTVMLALGALLLSAFPATRGLGLAGAVGVFVAMAYALFMLPPVLVLFGRRIFWPLVPKVGDTLSGDRGGIWRKVGNLVSGRPAGVLVLGGVVLAAGAAGLLPTKVGLSQNEQFLEKPEAIVGLEVLAQGFPAGASDPVEIVTTPSAAAQVQTKVAAIDGVASITPGPQTAELVQLNAVLDSETGSDEAVAQVEAIRAALADTPDTFVGGATAEQLDRDAATTQDIQRIVPLILIMVLGVLILLLRSLLAPVLLVFTVVFNFAASMGLSWWVSHSIFGFPALEGGVPLLAFLFLVALGVDYNIFLVTRAREDAKTHGTGPGMLRALSATGGVITSAGILLAAVFAVLGVLPLVTLTQIGVIVCIGVLLDTLLVRTIIVPALAVLLGDRFWWPGKRPQEV